MTNRDRLIELITKEVPRPKADALAGWLLANGVIVPPCKVGDKLYYIPFGSTITQWEIRSMEITQDDIVFHCGRIFFLNHDIGKTVFLTKEEAERELEKRCNNA